MFVNNIPLIVIIIKRLKFTIIEYILSESEKSLVNSINKIVTHYKLYGLYVRTMFVDPEFQFLEYKVFSTVINTTGAIDHIPEVDKHIQVVNDRGTRTSIQSTYPLFHTPN